MLYEIVDCLNIFSGIVSLITFDLGDKPSIIFGCVLASISLAFNGLRAVDLLKNDHVKTNRLQNIGDFHTNILKGDLISWTYLTIIWIFFGELSNFQFDRKTPYYFLS